MSHFSVAVFTETGTEEEVKRLLAPYQENNMGDCPKEYLTFVEDEDFDIDEETGKHGYWENPNAKWDWYQLGGRWPGLLVSAKGSGLRGTPSIFGGGRYKNDEYDCCLRELAEADKEGRCGVQPRSDDTQTAMPAGAAPIVYCKDCAYLRYSDFYGECSRGLLGIVGPLDYCRRGRVKEGEG